MTYKQLQVVLDFETYDFVGCVLMHKAQAQF
jgi:hypothetical protein